MTNDSAATITLQAAYGCGSIVTLNLTINSSVVGTDYQTACDFYTWIDGNIYTNSNTQPPIFCKPIMAAT